MRVWVVTASTLDDQTELVAVYDTQKKAQRRVARLFREVEAYQAALKAMTSLEKNWSAWSTYDHFHAHVETVR